MPKSLNKYHRKIGIFFLSTYFCFIFLGTIHYHTFDLNSKDEIANQVNDNYYSDLNSDFFSVCRLHQFAQTIDDTHFSSEDIILSLSKVETNLSHLKLRTPLPVISSEKSPRAPPAFIS